MAMSKIISFTVKHGRRLQVSEQLEALVVPMNECPQGWEEALASEFFYFCSQHGQKGSGIHPALVGANLILWRDHDCDEPCWTEERGYADRHSHPRSEYDQMLSDGEEGKKLVSKLLVRVPGS